MSPLIFVYIIYGRVLNAKVTAYISSVLVNIIQFFLPVQTRSNLQANSLGDGGALSCSILTPQKSCSYAGRRYVFCVLCILPVCLLDTRTYGQKVANHLTMCRHLQCQCPVIFPQSYH